MDSGEFDVEQLVGLLRDAAHAVRSVTTSPTDEARALVLARNAVDARLADLLAVIDETKAHEAEGCASVRTWAARELGLDTDVTRQMVRASATMRDLYIIDWAYGGTTNLANLVGLCRKCHRLVTMGRLTLTGTWDTGYTFTTARGRPLSRTG